MNGRKSKPFYTLLSLESPEFLKLDGVLNSDILSLYFGDMFSDHPLVGIEKAEAAT